MDFEQIKNDLIRDEGLRLKVYHCTAGKLTIGVGRNLEDNWFSSNEVAYLLENLERKKRMSKIPGTVNTVLLDDIIKNGISEKEAFYLLENDINKFAEELFKLLPWVKERSDNLKRVLINMIFNVGSKKLLTFKRTLSLMKEGRYKEASIEMLNSKWANEVGKRAVRLSNLVANEV